MLAPAPHDGVVQRIAELETRLEAVTARLTALESMHIPRDNGDSALLHVLASEIGERSFTAIDLLRHAALKPRLHAALIGADLTNAREIGCWLRRRLISERGPAAGLRIELAKRTGGRRFWRVCLCADEQAHPEAG
jgi:hypothetical protein